MQHYKQPNSGRVFAYDPADVNIPGFMLKHAGLNETDGASFAQAEAAILAAGWEKLALWPPAPSVAELQALCAIEAQKRLAATDWSDLVSVQQSLTNCAEFAEYRQKVRQYRTNPVATPVWPVAPKPVWRA